ncbi:MAG: hypothetical protein FWD02_01700 [Bacteroidales bacterium]|nr:hypothetical protein [Bacteroidales bacterium]
MIVSPAPANSNAGPTRQETERWLSEQLRLYGRPEIGTIFSLNVRDCSIIVSYGNRERTVTETIPISAFRSDGSFSGRVTISTTFSDFTRTPRSETGTTRFRISTSEDMLARIRRAIEHYQSSFCNDPF